VSAPTHTARVYGPVPSRRFGISLGVDLVPRKVCCYDCIYCQVGRTTDLTATRATFFDPRQVVDEVARALSSPEGPRAEIITLAGSGEPTLYRELDRIVDGLRDVTRLPLALLTNGALLWQEEVREVALRFDLVAPSLDAADPETFQRVNRPAPELTLELVLGGLRQLCASHPGRCRLEILLVKGINDSPRALSALAEVARSLPRLEAVDLNTVVRPPAHTEISGLDPAELREALAYFVGCPAGIVVPFASTGESPTRGDDRLSLDQIRQLVARRPCSAADLQVSLGLGLDRVRAICDKALQQGLVWTEQRGETTYYRAGSTDNK